MKDKKNDLNNIIKLNNNKVEINIIKEEEFDSKDNNNASQNLNINTKDKNKENKGNISKNIDNHKNKIQGKNNINDNINQRINNFINLSNSNLRNRYYSSNTSNHIFRNFIKKSNYNNKNRDNIDNINGANDNNIQNYFDNNYQNRTYSFTSRINNNYINKGLNYILGNENPNNINNKEIIDIRKKDGYDYKKYNRGKRNNYVNKKIFFKDNKILNIDQNNQNQNNINLTGNNIFNNNYPQNTQLLNNNNFNNNIDFSFYKNNTNNTNNITSSKQHFLHLNDFLILDNLDLKIMIIGNNLLNYIGNNINNVNNINNITNVNQKYNLLNFEPNSMSLINPESIDYYKNNSNNIGLNSMNFNMNRNLFFG